MAGSRCLEPGHSRTEMRPPMGRDRHRLGAAPWSGEGGHTRVAQPVALSWALSPQTPDGRPLPPAACASCPRVSYRYF